MAFQLADEMVEVGFIPDQDTYVSLLIACQSDKTLGFRYAIEVRRQKYDRNKCTACSF